MKPKILGAFVLLLALMFCGNAAASKYKLHLTQSPVPAYVDDPKVIISWNVERTLARGYHFVGHIVNKTQEAFRCANNVYAKTHKRAHRGEEAHLLLEPGYDGYTEWCAGRFELSIAIQRNTKKECDENLCESFRDIGLNWFIEAEIRIFQKP